MGRTASPNVARSHSNPRARGEFKAAEITCRKAKYRLIPDLGAGGRELLLTSPNSSRHFRRRRRRAGGGARLQGRAVCRADTPPRRRVHPALLAINSSRSGINYRCDAAGHPGAAAADLCCGAEFGRLYTSFGGVSRNCTVHVVALRPCTGDGALARTDRPFIYFGWAPYGCSVDCVQDVPEPGWVQGVESLLHARAGFYCFCSDWLLQSDTV